ncbi:hypothetical protein [Chitinimonas naiadis]
MRPITLDFVRPRLVLSLPGAVLLILGLAAISALSWQLSSLDAERELLEGRLWRLQAPATPASDADTLALAAADKLTTQIRRPWVPLFQQLEQIKGKGVRLGQILPQAGDKASVQLGGEAEDAESLYAYLRQLRSEGGLREVYLLQQRWDAESETIRFVAQARWQAGADPEPTP